MDPEHCTNLGVGGWERVRNALFREDALQRPTHLSEWGAGGDWWELTGWISPGDSLPWLLGL